MRVVFDQVNIVSGDMAASLEFYRRLGVALPDKNIWTTASGIHHANADNGDDGPDLDLDSAPFARLWNPAWAGLSSIAGRVVIGFRADSRESVDTIYADLTAAGHRGLHPPHDAFWGSRYAIVEDPDGLAIGIMSPPSSNFRAAPPEV